MTFVKSVTRPSPRFFLAIFGFSFVFLFFALSSVPFAQDISLKHLAGVTKSELDGLRFVGPFGAEGEVKPKEDVFTFKDGKFATAICLEWGFIPAPFWTRRDSKGLHFLAELKSPDHGTMRYQGTYDGKVLSVVGYWKKERWYWTIERTYRGTGRPAGPAK